MKTKVYLMQVLVVDVNNMGEECIRENLEYVRHVSPQILNCFVREVDWHDDHPLNKLETKRQAVNALFQNTYMEGF
jgi:hypothetical protein